MSSRRFYPRALDIARTPFQSCKDRHRKGRGVSAIESYIIVTQRRKTMEGSFLVYRCRSKQIGVRLVSGYITTELYQYYKYCNGMGKTNIRRDRLLTPIHVPWVSCLTRSKSLEEKSKRAYFLSVCVYFAGTYTA